MTTPSKPQPKEIPPCAKHTNPQQHPPPALRMTTLTHVTPATTHVRLQVTCAQGTTLTHVIPTPSHVIPAKAGIHPAASKPPKRRPSSRRLQNPTRTDRTQQDSTETRARAHAREATGVPSPFSLHWVAPRSQRIRGIAWSRRLIRATPIHRTEPFGPCAWILLADCPEVL